MNYTPKFRTEKTKKLFGIHQQVEKGKLSKETAMKKAAALGYTSGGASSWFSWWRAKAKEALGLDDSAKFSDRHQRRLAAKLKATASEMKEADKATFAGVVTGTGRLSNTGNSRIRDAAAKRAAKRSA